MPIAPRLPLTRDFVYGYGMNDTIKDTVRQNLTNLLLTIPGERVMDPEFSFRSDTCLINLWQFEIIALSSLM